MHKSVQVIKEPTLVIMPKLFELHITDTEPESVCNNVSILFSRDTCYGILSYDNIMIPTAQLMDIQREVRARRQ